MNWKQQRVKEHIDQIFAPDTVTITVDGPESLKATDQSSESLIFWYDDQSGLVMDAHHWKQQYEAWRAMQPARRMEEKA